MAKTIKTKKVSITAFEKVMKETCTPIQTIEWNEIEISIKHTLSLKEVMTFVDNVTKSCFLVDSNTYLPEIKEFAIKCCVLEMYANFTLPSNVERKYDLVYNTDAFNRVMPHINTEQLSEITDAIDDKIDNLVHSNIEFVQRQTYELYSTLDALQKQISGTFEGISSEDISKLVEAVAEGGIDEEKLVQAYNQHKALKSEESDE